MSTEAQIAANQLNALKSTGPKTEEGKAVVAQNALKHGLYSTRAVLPTENPAEFLSLLEELTAELKPSGPLETHLVAHIATLLWRSRRLPAAEASILRECMVEYRDEQEEEQKYVRPAKRQPIADAPPEHCLLQALESQPFEDLDVYQTKLQRALQATLRQLHDLQKLKNPKTNPISS